MRPCAHAPLQEVPRARLPLALKDLHTLRDGTWLNDEVINSSMALMQARPARAPGTLHHFLYHLHVHQAPDSICHCDITQCYSAVYTVLQYTHFK